MRSEVKRTKGNCWDLYTYYQTTWINNPKLIIQVKYISKNIKSIFMILNFFFTLPVNILPSTNCILCIRQCFRIEVKYCENFMHFMAFLWQIKQLTFMYMHRVTSQHNFNWKSVRLFLIFVIIIRLRCMVII